MRLRKFTPRTYRKSANRWRSPKESPDFLPISHHDGSFVISKSHFIGRSTVDLHKNGDVLKLHMPLRGKTASNIGDKFVPPPISGLTVYRSARFVRNMSTRSASNLFIGVV